MSFVPDRSVPAIVQIRNALEYLTGFRYASGSISLLGLPVEGDLIEIFDLSGSIVYEFVDAEGNGVEAGAVEVLIGAEIAESIDNLHVAINDSSLQYRFSSVDGGATFNGSRVTDPQGGILPSHTIAESYYEIALKALVGGVSGNIAIVATVNDAGDYTIVGMTGGA